MNLPEQQAALKRAIVRCEGTPAVSGLLHVYQQAYTARLAAALRDNFGVLPRVLGDDAFEALACAYIDAHPSARPSIRWFGDRLPEFMASRDDLVPHAALVDLARMEWALRSAFDAADAEPLTANELADVPAGDWPALVFRPLPSVQLLALRWNVGSVWRALQAAPASDLPEPQALEHTLLIWRKGLEARWRTLDASAARLLKCALHGDAFAELCALAAGEVGDEQAALHAAGALRGWIADGLFRR
jgi:hypothetical protein